jgi:hypothetical protein
MDREGNSCSLQFVLLSEVSQRDPHGRSISEVCIHAIQEEYNQDRFDLAAVIEGH